MDKVIEKKNWRLPRIALLGMAVIGLSLVGWQLLSRTGGSRLRVDTARITTAVAQEGEFLDYYPFDGRVEPGTSVFLDIEEGGRVDEIFAEGGQHVEKDDLILRFSNAALQRTSIDTETQLLYNLDIQRNTQFIRQQSTLVLKETLLELDHQIEELDKKYHRYEALMKDGNTAISVELFETTRNQLQYLKDRRTLLAERIRQEDQMAARQLAESGKSVERLNKSMDLLGKIVKSLEVRAPISGYLSTIDAQVGQSIARGQRIGQIDLLDSLKLRIRIDQFYISRVELGTPGRLELDGKSWPVKVQKIYPEVKQNAFEADVVFTDGTPETLKRGQTLPVDLTFGSPKRSLLVARGGFYQQTSGRWVYLIAPDGRTARKTPVRLGKQNPLQIEVLEGLRPGDRIITSGYDAYNGVEELRFDSPVKTAKN
jgi:HlyD family secretion protein